MTLLAEDCLRASTGSKRISGGWIATTSEPWVAVHPPELLTRHRWIRLKYSSSFMDEPVRPLIRFTTAIGGVIVEPMNGTVLGSAEWLGRIPPHTVEIAISPSRRIGPVNFRIDSIESETTVRLLLRGFFRSKLWTYWTLRCLAVGSRREAWQALKSATEGTPVEEYAGWHMKNAREPDFAGFDAPRGDPAKGPRFIIVVTVSNATPRALLRTMRSLTEQSYPNYVIAAILDETPPAEHGRGVRGRAAAQRTF